MVCQRISLALGGGGARGLAHLGVIAALRDAQLEIERLVGISIGSLVGALYAFHPDIDRVQERIVGFLASPAFRRHQQRLSASQGADRNGSEHSFSWWRRLTRFLRANYVCGRVLLRQSILPGDVLRHAANSLLPDADIADACVPLSVVAVDLLEGAPVILEKGPVRDAVCASASIPGIFPPVEFEGRLLCDIGVLNSLPTLATRSYPTRCLVAVDVSSSLQAVNACQNAVDVLVRVNNIGENLFRRNVFAAADLVIRPEVGDVPWFEFSNPSRLIRLGREAARGAVPGILDRCCGG